MKKKGTRRYKYEEIKKWNDDVYTWNKKQIQKRKATYR